MEFAEKLRMTHKQDHPDYKYQPRRKKARTLTTSAVQSGEGIMQTTNINSGSSVTTSATVMSTKTNNMDLRGCKKLTGHKSGKSTTATQQHNQTGGSKLKINVNNNNDGDPANNNNAIGSDMFSNEAFMTSFNNACAASLLQQQQHMPKDSNQIGGGCEYLLPMDSPNSNTSSLHSTSMIINYGSVAEEPPLTPPATPAYTLGGNINCAAKHTNTAALGRQPTSLLLRQLSGTENTNIGGESDLLCLNETNNVGSNTELMSACNSAYNETSNGAGIEFLEFSGLEYGAQYTSQPQQHHHVMPNNRFQNCNNNTSENCQPHAAYVGYNGVSDSSLGLSAYNFFPSSSALKMHNYTTIGASGDVLDPKEMDQYLTEHVLPITHNQTTITKAHTTLTNIISNTDTMATRMKLCSSSSTSSSSSSSPSSSSYSSTSSTSASSSLASPLYKQMSTHMLHELQPPVLDTSTSTISTTITTPTINVSSNSVGQTNDNVEDGTTAFVSVTHSLVAANGGNYYYSPVHYSSETVISSSTSASTPTATGFQHYIQQSQQQLENEQHSEHLCVSEQQQQQSWEHFVSP